jgi:hypothetical protein
MKPLPSSLNYTRGWEEAIFLLRLPLDFFWMHVIGGLPSTKTLCISVGHVMNVKKKEPNLLHYNKISDGTTVKPIHEMGVKLYYAYKTSGKVHWK